MNETLKLPQAGDLLGFSGDGWLSAGINLATYGIPYWSLSHVGIVGEYKGRTLLFESCLEDADPCEIKGKVFSGTQAHTIESRLTDYHGKIWHYPLYRSLYDFERKRLNRFLRDTTGIPYDEIGAFRAGGIGFSWLESLLREADLSSLFCSEWCAAAHSTIGIFQTDNASRWSPNKLVRHERRQEILLAPRRLK
jgi:hypothetical protein